MFFGDQREAFLAFLRNLTPQIAFLMLAFISASRLDGTWQLDWDGVRNALPMLMSLFVFCGAMLANVSWFIDAVTTSSPEMSEASKTIKKEEFPASIQGRRNRIAATWKYDKPAMVNLVLAVVIAETALALVFVMAYQQVLASPFAK